LKDDGKTISLSPHSSYYHSIRARLYDVLHKRKLALADDDEAVRLAPNDAQAVSNLAMDRLKAGRNDEAKDLFAKSIALKPTYNDYYQLSDIARKQGNPKLADEYMEKARSCPANGNIRQPGDPIDPNTPVGEFPPKIHHGHGPIHYKTAGELEREKQAKIEKGAHIHHSFSSSGPKQSGLPASGIHYAQPSTGQ
jgi:tetratricopeptide (TPR) repeat protein